MTVGEIDLRRGDGVSGLAEFGEHAVDHVITDPPFDARTHRTALEVGDWRRGDRSVGGALPFAHLEPDDVERIAAELARVARRWIIVFAAERQLELWSRSLEASGARFVRVGLAVRTNPRPQLSGDRPAPAADHLVIAHATGEAMRWNGRGRAARWDAPAARWDPGGQVHPCQKSVRLMRALLDDFTDPGELVCDPFAGGGTTAVACKELGRRFVGWEIEPGYHADALERIAAAQRELGAPAPVAKQGELLW